ncbi:MAG: hypothetical protein P8Y94_12755 [Acidobacteriota bacterium]
MRIVQLVMLGVVTLCSGPGLFGASPQGKGQELSGHFRQPIPRGAVRSAGDRVWVLSERDPTLTRYGLDGKAEREFDLHADSARTGITMGTRPLPFAVADDGAAYLVVNRCIPDASRIYTCLVTYPVGEGDIEIKSSDLELDVQQVAVAPTGDSSRSALDSVATMAGPVTMDCDDIMDRVMIESWIMDHEGEGLTLFNVSSFCRPPAGVDRRRP